jgi:hypothetical protein
MYLSNQSLLVIIVVGIVAGYPAGRVMRGGWADRRFGRNAARSSGVMPVKSNPTGSASVSITI